jgi:hypothetical protein
MAKAPLQPERIEDTSADLAYELQAKLFEQLATVSLGGAGLAITLAGSILRDSPLVWLSVIEFGIGALLALSAHQGLIGRLFDRKPARKSAKTMTGVCMMLIGMGVGSLGGAVYFASERAAVAATALPL